MRVIYDIGDELLGTNDGDEYTLVVEKVFIDPWDGVVYLMDDDSRWGSRALKPKMVKGLSAVCPKCGCEHGIGGPDAKG